MTERKTISNMMVTFTLGGLVLIGLATYVGLGMTGLLVYVGLVCLLFGIASRNMLKDHDKAAAKGGMEA